MIAAAGAAISFWMASRQDAHKLPALPTFNERFWLVAPTLFEGTAGILFGIWALLLIREVSARSEPRVISSVTAAEAARTKRWTTAKWGLFLVFILATVPSLGGNYLKYLWPSYPQWITQAARSIFDVLGLFGAFVESYRRRKKQSPQQGTGFGAERVPWLDDRQKTFILVTVVGMALIFGIYYAARNLPLSSLHRIMTISILVLAVIQVMILQAHRKPEQNGPNSEIQARSLAPTAGVPNRTNWLSKVVVWAVVALVMVAILSPIPREFKTAAFFALIAILVIWGMALTKLKRRVYGLSMQGKFDEALQEDRRWSRIPGYGGSLAGMIYFNAGRYAEAQVLAKPFAFDEQGKPKVASTDFYVYSLALVNDGKEAEAQKLLEAAVAAPQRTAGFHVALATCLLSQKKDAARACELLEQAMATPNPPMPAYERKSDDMKRLGRYAWALAAAGRRAEAEAKIREAVAGSTSLKGRDLAGVHYFSGEAWRALGERKQARDAFNEAMRLSPEGPPATGSRKALARMRDEAQG
jgi:tetratricopeptide (TPR) repeat protein